MHQTYEKFFFSRQLMCLEAQNVDQLIKQYNHDAVLVRFNGIMRGHEAIRSFFTDYFAQHPGLEVKSVLQYHESQDIISGLIVTVSQRSEQHLSFTFLLQAGKILYEIATLVQEQRSGEELRPTP